MYYDTYMSFTTNKEVKMTKSETHMRLQAIEEYVDAVADYHEAKLLLAEMMKRVVSAVDSNKAAGISKPDPLGAIIRTRPYVISPPQIDAAIQRVTTTVARKSVNKKPRTPNSKRNSPGQSKKLVYEALPGSAGDVAKRTGLSRGQVTAAVAELIGAGVAEKYGSRGNTTYATKGDRIDLSPRGFAGLHYNAPLAG